MSFISKPFYRGITKWANQPRIPAFVSCTFKDSPDQDLLSIPTLGDLKKYNVILKLNDSLGESSAIIFTDNPDISLNPKDDPSLPLVGNKNILIIDGPADRTEIEVSATISTRHINYSGKILSSSECPIELAFIGGKK